MKYLIDHLWTILFVLGAIPLLICRSNFRKIVYQVDDWSINVRPIFMKEMKGLLGNIYPGNAKYKRLRNSYRFWLIGYLLLFLLYIGTDLYAQKIGDKAMNKITVGSTVPSFTLKDQFGNTFNIDSVKGKTNLVIYFYPKDDSPGCTSQACAFRDQFDVFNDVNATIIGISSQSVDSHLKFAKKHRLNYTLLSDEGNKVRKLFGVPSNMLGIIPGRVTYIVDREGKVVFTFDSQVNATKHVDEALRILKGL